MATITLTLSRKPLKQVDRTDSVINECRDNFCNKCGESFAVHNDDGSCIEDDITENEETEPMDEIPDPPKVEYPQTGKGTMLAENLAKCLSIVKDTVGSNTLPILNKVKIDFKNGMATFTTTNLETMTITRCGCKIESEFTCVLSFKILKELSELLYDDAVTFEQSTSSGETYLSNRHYSNVPTVLIKQGRQTITLFDDKPEDYPPMPKVEGGSVAISELAETIKKVKDRILDSNYRHNAYEIAAHMNGLYFDLSKPNIVATDGYKMKIAKLECEAIPIQFRIDKECALLLAKFKDTDCRITSSDKVTQFDLGGYVRHGDLGNITVITQDLQGKYPDYETLKETEKDKVCVC
jgi:DNA polymerase III sliding clamp (beta) subunit (PCNA family)